MSGAPARALRVKICGLKTPDLVDAAVAAGASYVGFVFVPGSPRAITPAEAASLAAHAPPGVAKVGLVADADDAALDAILAAAPLDMLQLHGHESPERVAAVRSRTGLPVIRAIGVAGPADLAALDAHEGAADMIMCDAKPPPGAALKGGTGVAFDWTVLSGRRWRRPWMLAGGLTAETVQDAAAASGATEVDVSSGVEIRRGEKSKDKIEAFLAAAGAGQATFRGTGDMPVGRTGTSDAR